MKLLFKRALALVLTLCLMLPLGAVMPVQAEGAAATAKVEVEYSFYNPAFAIKEGSFGELIDNDGTVNSNLASSYENKEFNIAPYAYSSSSTSPRQANYYNYDSTIFQYKGLMFWSKVGDWIAFKIQSPGTGNYTISVDRYYNVNNTKGCDFYIFNSTANFDVAAALQETDVNNYLVNKNSDGSVIDVSLRASGTVEVGTMNFTAENEYILVMKPRIAKGTNSTNARIHLTSLTMTSEETDLDTAISNATTKFHTVKLTSATTTLQGATDLGPAALSVSTGSTLDLNGQSLTAASVASFGNVIDSSANAAGSLVVASDKLTLQSTNSQVSLYDTGNGCYKFYTATLESLNPTTVDDTSSKYWFRLNFSTSSAYDLIAAGNSGLEIGANLSWTGTDGTQTLYATPDPEGNFYSGWANAVKDNPDIAINLTVKGIDQVEDFALTPTVKSTTGVIVQ